MVSRPDEERFQNLSELWQHEAPVRQLQGYQLPRPVPQRVVRYFAAGLVVLFAASQIPGLQVLVEAVPLELKVTLVLVIAFSGAFTGPEGRPLHQTAASLFAGLCMGRTRVRYARALPFSGVLRPWRTAVMIAGDQRGAWLEAGKLTARRKTTVAMHFRVKRSKHDRSRVAQISGEFGHEPVKTKLESGQTLIFSDLRKADR